MNVRIPRGFLHEVYYPADLADRGLAPSTLYHGVSKYLMTGLSAFTVPYYGAIIERHKPIDNLRTKYLNVTERNPLDTKQLDDTFILAESSSCLWIFWSPFADACGTVGRIQKKIMTKEELLCNMRQYLLDMPALEPRPGRFSGCFLEIPVCGKTIIFQ